MSVSVEKPKVLMIASLSSMLWVFYRPLIKQLSADGYKVTLAASDDYNLDRFASEYKCKIIPLKILRKISLVSDMFCMLTLAYLMRRNSYDVVHVHTPKGGVIGLCAAFLARMPVRLYTIHGLPLETADGLNRKLLWLSEKLSCFLSTHILSVSESLRKKIVRERLCSSEKISVLQNGTACGIDLKRFNANERTVQLGLQVRKQFGIAENQFVIGYIGRLTPEKGTDVLVRSFLELASSRDDLYLLLVGDLDLVREILDSEIVDAIRSHPRIVHVNFQNEVVPFYAAMDIFTMPTRREGFGITFLEAGAMSLPVIGTQVTGCVDAIVNGETGLLVNSGDGLALKEAIIKLITDKDLRYRLGRNGRERVEKYFCSDLLVKAYIDYYNKLLSGSDYQSNIRV